MTDADAPPVIVRVAVPSPLRRTFDYLAPNSRGVEPGVRVLVPFGRRDVVGVVIESGVDSDLEQARLRCITRVLDAEPLLDIQLLTLLKFASDYYHHPIGEVAQTMLPVALRRPKPIKRSGTQRWVATPEGHNINLVSLSRAPRQAAALRLLRSAGESGYTRAEVDELAESSGVGLAALARRGLAEKRTDEVAILAPLPRASQTTLNAAQSAAVDAIRSSLGAFETHLVDGVTGSGKTEVYLAAVQAALAVERQVLILVPEIGLTPQMLDRFRRCLDVPLVVTHSGLADGARAGAWLACREGRGQVVIGTRSAIFMPLDNLGLIIVDEEHDLSYKQQDGLRYSARDLALVRGQAAGVPVVLGSATPSLESLHNVTLGRFHRAELSERAGDAKPPSLHLVDVRAQRLNGALSETVVDAAAAAFGRGEQVLMFVNRRGFAPALICHLCGHVHECPRCDAKLVLHRRVNRLKCHHCGHDQPAITACESCGGEALLPVGAGTERLEEELRSRFPDVPSVRIDRDTTRRQGELEAALQAARSGEYKLLIGTQMLAKGHHFPGVTVVAILDADSGLFSTDFRATERLAQLITQVAGRAGRAERPGQVFIQTHQPEHPLLQALLHGKYGDFASAALSERQVTQLPPASAMALIRAEAPQLSVAMAFLDDVKTSLRAYPNAQALEFYAPTPAPMERRQGRFRAQLAILGPDKRAVHAGLRGWVATLESLPSARKVRWSLDIDPQDVA